MIGVVTFIGDRDLGSEAVNQFVRKGDVVALPWLADQADRVAKPVTCGVDFRAQAPARPAKALGIRPLFAGVRRPRADAPAR